MGVNILPQTVTRQRRGCDLNPGPSAPESSTLTTRLPSHPLTGSTGDVSPRCLTTRGVSWSSSETSRCRSERCVADCCPRNTRGTSDTLHTSHPTHVCYHRVTYSICRNRNCFQQKNLQWRKNGVAMKIVTRQK